MHWYGEFAFGDVWLAFSGASADNRMHAHAAVQLVASASAVSVTDDAGRSFTGAGWAIRSGVRHALQPAQALTLVLIEPQARLASQLLALLGTDASISPIPTDLVAVLTSPARLSHRIEALQRVRSELAPPPVDARLAAALRQLERQTAGDAVAVASAQAGLSVSRLRALSQAQFGVPLSKLLLWKKVRRACLLMAGGSNLVEAALDSGFADQAHLTRTMAAVIGLTPGEARSVAP